MAIYHVTGATSTLLIEAGVVPDDANDGLDMFGLSVITTGSITWDAATRTMQNSVNWGGFFFGPIIAGKFVYVNWGGAAGGVNGLYEIEALNGTEDGLILKSVTGLATVNSSALSTSNGPWATFEKAATSRTASSGGDEYRICNANWFTGVECVYQRTAANFTWSATGTAANRVRVRAADGFGIPTTGRFTLRGSTAGGGSTPILTMVASAVYVTFEGILALGGDQGGGAPTIGFQASNSSVADVTFANCLADSVSSYGFTVSGSLSRIQFNRCISKNASVGFYLPGSGTGLMLSSCTAIGSSSHGFHVSSTVVSTIENCLAVANSGDGFNHSGAASGTQFIDCLAYGNTGDGFDISAGTNSRLAYCSAVSNGGWGYNFPATDSKIGAFIRNHSYGNVSGHVGTSSTANTYFENLLASVADPLFVSTVPGSLNLKVKGASPLLVAGSTVSVGQSATQYRSVGGAVGSSSSSSSGLRNRFN